MSALSFMIAPNISFHELSAAMLIIGAGLEGELASLKTIILQRKGFYWHLLFIINNFWLLFCFSFISLFTVSHHITIKGIGWAGFGVNHLDIAPRYASILIGITNTCATVPNIIVPILVGVISKTGVCLFLLNYCIKASHNKKFRGFALWFKKFNAAKNEFKKYIHSTAKLIAAWFKFGVKQPKMSFQEIKMHAFCIKNDIFLY